MSERDAAAAGLSAQDAAEKQTDDDGQRAAGAENTLLEQMGGVSGLAYSAVPIVVFVLVSSFTSLMPAIWSAIGVAVAIAIFRLVRKEPLQPAISGVIGVAVCSFIAYRSGDAKGFFLLGIWTSLIYGGLFLVSVLARWPLVGVAWSALNGLGFSWRKQRRALRGYDLATLAWVAVFGAKYVVQQWLYDADQTGWLAFARIAMGYPLTGLALIVTVWAIRRAAKVAEQEKAAAESTAVSPNPSVG
ncbi:Protein of unknown function [Saccharopolyspora kobensis]|uniref:DUF3159 domain-containing protein n=1 Tax=Saccharopolyspora kobensis TaxID=146035 RepID=A0A1H6DPX0_9PSEU|nr:DUF3159 domain-containing protein [Saccharopolyspora kobensis]SEG87372.1 Protein of unknown function [Saccharopolyspora kobensis]SFE06756.1 Protein of unknown function [Saccharopolyspora kobensis]